MEASRRAGRFKSTGVGRLQRTGINEYSAIGAEVILRQSQPRIEVIVGKKLMPAYALWRIYKTGDSLRRHVDRDACEVSVSLPILAIPVDVPWPIHVCDFNNEECAVALLPGAGIVYQGCRVPHWREPFAGEHQYQLFLHYVIKDGERSNFAFDGRGGLGLQISNDVAD